MQTTIKSIKLAQFVKKSVDIHCHGIGKFDFTEILELRLLEIEGLLAERGQRVILTLYLPEPSFDDFLMLMESFAQGKSEGKYKHIIGLALEGPLLASHGGTPHKGVWNPSKAQWRQLAQCGKYGLIYVIFSPDAVLDESGSTRLDAPANNVTWIAETLLNGGVLPAAGHFTRDNPLKSARSLQTIYDVVAAWGCGPTVTDHLYNDMPHNFKHAWRTPEELKNYQKEIRALDLRAWTLNNLEEKLGLVPATMIRNAHKGLVKIAINFDGEHVDLAIVKKTVDLIGAENMLMMTDSIESRRLAGRTLKMHEGSTLLYQDEDVVAAGSQGVYRQIENMLRIGLTDEQIDLITNLVPSSVFEQRNDYVDQEQKVACV